MSPESITVKASLVADKGGTWLGCLTCDWPLHSGSALAAYDGPMNFCKGPTQPAQLCLGAASRQCEPWHICLQAPLSIKQPLPRLQMPAIYCTRAAELAGSHTDRVTGGHYSMHSICFVWTVRCPEPLIQTTFRAREILKGGVGSHVEVSLGRVERARPRVGAGRCPR